MREAAAAARRRGAGAGAHDEAVVRAPAGRALAAHRVVVAASVDAGLAARVGGERAAQCARGRRDGAGGARAPVPVRRRRAAARAGLAAGHPVRDDLSAARSGEGDDDRGEAEEGAHPRMVALPQRRATRRRGDRSAPRASDERPTMGAEAFVPVERRRPCGGGGGAPGDGSAPMAAAAARC